MPYAALAEILHRKRYLARPMPPVVVRRCPAIGGYRLLGVHRPGAWTAFRGAWVESKGQRRWEPRNGANGGAVVSTRPGLKVAHYARLPGWAVARRDDEELSTGWRPRRARRPRAVPAGAFDTRIPLAAVRRERELV